MAFLKCEKLYWLKTKRETDEGVKVRCRAGDAEIAPRIKLKVVVDGVDETQVELPLPL